MGVLNISEMIYIIRKYFLRILAFSLALGLAGGYVATLLQTYTCTLGFKYNYDEAIEGIAPDGVSKLDPYEIQNPVVIQAAIRNMGLKSDDEKSVVRGIRENISITPIVTNLDKEVSDSAALLGEKYDVFATEYEMSFTYKASQGDIFGTKMFSNIINAYDEFLLLKYYNKKSIDDFAKTVSNSNAEYIVIADSISNSIEDIIAYLDDMSEYYPDFRSKTTGYTFSELSLLYQNLRDVQHAKYYGNVRAGNLAKDREMVIKSYKKKVKDLQEVLDVNYAISQNYKTEISTFYDSYKSAGLYRQAEQVQRNTDSSNNRDQDVIDDKELEEYKNTYDEIVLNYTNHAGDATDALHTINYYNTIIQSYSNDVVSSATKKSLLEKNKTILSEISDLSKDYALIANRTLDELYNSKISNDLQYLILPEVTPDKPIKLIVVFLIILGFGLATILVIIMEIMKKFAKPFKEVEKSAEKVFIDTENMDELHQLLYQQYLDGFSEFYLVYQSMVSSDNSSAPHREVFIRWESPQLGMVSPGKIIDCISDFNIFNEFNDWIIKNVCENLAALNDKNKVLPVTHINCPYSQVEDFALNDIIIKHIRKNDIPAEKICLELDGKEISNSLEYIMVLNEIGVQICIDKFENSEEENEILYVVQPGYIKMSLDILNSDIYATSDEDILEAEENMTSYFSDIIEKCRKNGVKACICGIEKKSQDKLVSDIGFDYKQGYYYGKPERE